MVQVHYPPVTPFNQNKSLKIFLAGTIDMGLSVDWQQIMIDHLTSKFTNAPLDIFNPRRKDWDSSWEQSASHPMFKRQVEWELCYQEQADIILMVLLESSKSPISLLELGSFKHKSILVFNPTGFYRHGNVEIFCRKYDVKTFNDWDDYLIAVRRFVDGHLLKNNFYAQSAH